ncbi:MAG: POTRA domain-containing protein, partial [Bacteroidota bacterium]
MISKRFVLLTIIFFALLGITFGVNIGLLEISGNVTISTEEILSVITKCHEGNEVTYADIERDVFNVKDMGYFEDVKYKLSKYDENSQILTIEVIEYPIISDIKLNISGPGLVPKKTLEEYITVETGKALNYKRLIRSQNAIKNQYIVADYQLLEIKNNIQENEQEIYLPNDTLVIDIWEYALYDLVIKGDFGDIQYDEVKELLDLRLLKDYYDDFFKLFLIKKNYYPTNTELQMAFSRLYNTGLIGPDTNVDFENH